MKRFDLILKNENLKSYQFSGWLIITFNFITFLWLGISNIDKGLCAFSIAFISLFLLMTWFTKKINKKKTLTVLAIITVLICLKYNLWWLAILNMILIFIYPLIQKELRVMFDENQIDYPSFPVKKISWTEVDNVILKDGLLTIDLKNNKILQSEILETKNGFSIDENDFNQFCKEQITH